MANFRHGSAVVVSSSPSAPRCPRLAVSVGAVGHSSCTVHYWFVYTARTARFSRSRELRRVQARAAAEGRDGASSDPDTALRETQMVRVTSLNGEWLFGHGITVMGSLPGAEPSSLKIAEVESGILRSCLRNERRSRMARGNRGLKSTDSSMTRLRLHRSLRMGIREVESS